MWHPSADCAGASGAAAHASRFGGFVGPRAKSPLLPAIRDAPFGLAGSRRCADKPGVHSNEVHRWAERSDWS